MKGSILTLDIAPSRRLRLAVVAMHVLAGLAVWLADLAWGYRLPMAIVVVISLVVSVRQPGKISLRCYPDGSLNIRVGDDWVGAKLSTDTVVLPWLAVLRYRPEGQSGTETCVVLADSLGKDDFRGLRVWLRWRGKVA